MPAKQEGEARKRGEVWEARWYDADGVRRSKSGFETKTKAREHLKGELERVEKVRSGDLALESERPSTVDALLDMFLEKHGATVDPATERKLRTQLKHARKTFGNRDPNRLLRVELEDWRNALPRGNRHDVFRAFRQALTWASKRGLIERNASDDIENPSPKQHERKPVHPFETWAEIEAVAAELDERYAAIPIFVAATGLRPEEWIALHRSDIDRKQKLVHVQRRYTGGKEKEGTKTGPRRVVPLTQRALEALDRMRPRIDTKILFPAPRGGYIDVEKFRYREWTPALRAAGIEHRRVNDLRHTYATWAIAKGVPTLTLAQVMGTSTRQLEDTYVRWLDQTAESVRVLLDANEATG